MKNQKIQIQDLAKGALFGLLVVIMMAFTIGCGKKDRNEDLYGYGMIPGMGCQTCSSGSSSYIGAGIGNASSYNGGSAQFALEFYLDGGSSSSVVAQGFVNVSGNLNCGYYGGMHLESGQYSVQNRYAGQMSGQNISNVYFTIGNGYNNAEIKVDYASFWQATPKLYSCNSQSGNYGYDQLNGTFTVVSINGYQCNQTLYSNGSNQFQCPQ